MKRTIRSILASIVVLVAMGGVDCTTTPTVVPSTSLARVAGHDPIALDTAPKEDLRLVPVEAYVRTYLELFGGLAPLEVQKRARGGDGGALFDTWDDYLGALGFPDYKNDLPRGQQTNALMVATFERIGVALCDRAVEHDLQPNKKTKLVPKVAERVIFAFDLPATGDLELPAFAERFDVLHRTFLGYPAALASADRTQRFFDLYREIVAHHQKPDAPKSRLSPREAGWSAVCQGLIRHPEFHLY